jgi:soluble lytic murein transglycosylase
MIKFWLVVILFLPLTSIASPGFYLSKGSLTQGEQVLTYIKQKEWDKAFEIVSLIEDSTVQKYFLVKLYSISESKVEIQDLQDFIRRNQDWPNVGQVRKKLEETFSFGNSKIEEIIAWFTQYPPITSQGTKILAEAKFRKHIDLIKTLNRENLKMKEEIRSLIKQAWIKGNFSVQEETDFLLRYNHIISHADHVSRVDRLLWSNQPKVAERIIHKVHRDYQKLFKARIAIKDNPKDIGKILTTIPLALRKTPGIVFDSIVWYQKHDEQLKAVELIKTSHRINEHIKQWWKVRSRAIRELMEMKNYQAAYNLARNRGRLDSKDEPEVEWMAGWLAYSFLNKPSEAYTHFEKIYKLSQFSINKARGAYWAAKAASKIHKKELARKMLNIAAKYNFTFYGQLAALKLNKEARVTFKEVSSYTKADQEAFSKNQYAKAAYIAAYFNQKEEAKSYLVAALLHAKTEGEYFLIASAPEGIENKWLSVQAAKLLSFKGIILPQFNYPKVEEIKDYTKNDAFVHAIIRQESVFDISAISHAGAVGMMQVMPHVGRALAKELGIEFSSDKLLNDYKYNIRLGSYLLDKLLSQYDGSYILTAAAYNAGDTPVNRWIKSHGDPRSFTKIKDIVNWIEQIPYFETRNYVLRILENMEVYKAIIQDSKVSIGLRQDLRHSSNASVLVMHSSN